MELQELKDLFLRYLEADLLTQEEGERLLAGLEEIIERNESDLLLGMKYRLGEEEHVLTEKDAMGHYFELSMLYGEHEEDDHHHHDDDHNHDELPPAQTGHLHKWGWLYMLLTGLLAALSYYLIKAFS